jgi:hypothetical protein
MFVGCYSSEVASTWPGLEFLSEIKSGVLSEENSILLSNNTTRGRV